MRIAIINRHPSDVLGGSEMQCHNIATGLTRRGHDVSYIAPYGGGRYDTPYRVVPTAPSPAAMAAAALQSNPDIVYWRLNKYHFYRTVRRLDRVGVPVIFAISHINDTRVTSNYANPRAGALGLAQAAKQRVLTAFNHLGFRHVAAITSVNPDFIGILPIEQQLFVPNSVELEGQAFSWPRPYIVWVANLKPTKRPQLYVKLAEALAGKGVDFLMIGDIQSEEHRWIASTPVKGFHYLGKKSIPESNGVIRNALALVHTCQPEGFCNNFLQAWLQGVPTVSLGFDPAGYIQQYELGGHAQEDWELFTQQVSGLIDDPELARQKGQRAKQFAQANFSLERTIDVLEGFINKVVANRQLTLASATERS